MTGQPQSIILAGGRKRDSRKGGALELTFSTRSVEALDRRNSLAYTDSQEGAQRAAIVTVARALFGNNLQPNSQNGKLG